MAQLRYLLLQIRNGDDPIRAQEVDCFARHLECRPEAIEPFNLLDAAPTAQTIGQADVVLIGGSGHYSAAADGEAKEAWLDRAMECLREIHHLAKPTFASCWGFQAMARAMGGRCIHDLSSDELGTIKLHLTEAGKEDPLFATLPSPFVAQAGHEDHVVELPEDGVLLASSARVQNQAFRFVGKPIYCTQFHPELHLAAYLERVRNYSQYVERILGVPFEQFEANCHETPDANALLKRFVREVFG